MKLQRLPALLALLTLLISPSAALSARAVPPAASALRPAPHTVTAAGFDVSLPLRDLATQSAAPPAAATGGSKPK